MQSQQCLLASRIILITKSYPVTPVRSTFLLTSLSHLQSTIAIELIQFFSGFHDVIYRYIESSQVMNRGYGKRRFVKQVLQCDAERKL